MADRVKALIVIYTVIGLVLLLIGVVLSNQIVRGVLVVEGSLFYVLLVSAVLMIFIGLHWLVVGLASLRSSR